MAGGEIQCFFIILFQLQYTYIIAVFSKKYVQRKMTFSIGHYIMQVFAQLSVSSTIESWSSSSCMARNRLTIYIFPRSDIDNRFNDMPLAVHHPIPIPLGFPPITIRLPIPPPIPGIPESYYPEFAVTWNCWDFEIALFVFPRHNHHDDHRSRAGPGTLQHLIIIRYSQVIHIMISWSHGHFKYIEVQVCSGKTTGH